MLTRSHGVSRRLSRGIQAEAGRRGRTKRPRPEGVRGGGGGRPPAAAASPSFPPSFSKRGNALAAAWRGSEAARWRLRLLSQQIFDGREVDEGGPEAMTSFTHRDPKHLFVFYFFCFSFVFHRVHLPRGTVLATPPSLPDRSPFVSRVKLSSPEGGTLVCGLAFRFPSPTKGVVQFPI